MTSKHTPGPWFTSGENGRDGPAQCVRDERDEVLIADCEFSEDADLVEANAVAIAALPEVLVVLDEAYQLLYKWEEAISFDLEDDELDCTQVLDRIHAVMKKATGKKL